MSDIVEEGLTAEKQILVDWLAKPRDSRCSQQELGEKIGVSQTSIWKWKKEQAVIDATYKKKRQLLKADDLPDIIDALVKKAKEGKVNQAKLVFEWLGEIDGKANSGNNAVQVNINTGIPRSEEDIVDVDVEEE